MTFTSNIIEKLAKIKTIQHFTKSEPHDHFSKSVSEWHSRNPEEAEAYLKELYDRLGWKNNNPAKYMRTRHELEDWMYDQLPELGVEPDTRYPLYGSADLGYIPDVFQDMGSHFEVPVRGIENKLTFSIGDSIPRLGKLPPEQRQLYNLRQINDMDMQDLISQVNASTDNSRGQNYLEAQMWITPEEAERVARLVK